MKNELASIKSAENKASIITRLINSQSPNSLKQLRVICTRIMKA